MAWIAVVLMGFVLGAIGGGGGILTVPILVGFFGMKATEATGASLLVVALTSAVGAAQGIRLREVDLRAAFSLGIPSAIGSFCARQFLLPAIPLVIAGIDRNRLLLVGFACLMVVVAIRMAVPKKEVEPKVRPTLLIVLVGVSIGLVSGTFGAGGGFLVLPALTLLLGTDIKLAIPTSLTVITIQSLFGFMGELGKPVQWGVLLAVAGTAIVGLIGGMLVRGKVSGRSLQLAFSVIVLLVAAWIFVRPA